MKLPKVPADLGAKKIIKGIVWMWKVLIGIQVKKKLSLIKDDDIANALPKNIVEVFMTNIQKKTGKIVVIDNEPFFCISHSTVTDFARLRGWSTSVPL